MANARRVGLLWAVGCCPVLGWAAAWYSNQAAEGLGVAAATFLLAVFPAALAGAGNAVLGRRGWEVARAAVAGGVVCYLGFLAFVAWFFLTVPPEFFN